MAETIEAENMTTPPEAEVLAAQLQIAVASNIELRALNKGLEAENAELRTLINDNTTAQEILSTKAAAISEEIDIKQAAFVDIPAGLTSSEVQGIAAVRQAEINALEAKRTELKKYIRSEI